MPRVRVGSRMIINARAGIQASIHIHVQVHVSSGGRGVPGHAIGVVCVVAAGFLQHGFEGLHIYKLPKRGADEIRT